MALRPLVVVFALTTGGCYLSHVLPEGDGDPGDAGRRDDGVDAGRAPGPDLGPPIDAGTPMHPLGELAVGAWRTCGMRHDGTVVCWGDGQIAGVSVGSVPTEVPDITDAVHIATGGAWFDSWSGDSAIDVCVVRRSGGVRCSGIPSCGSGEGEATAAFDLPHIDDATDVVVLAEGVCAIRTSGEVDCWGSVDTFMAGDYCNPQALGVTDATQLSAGAFGVCALRRNGHVACFGEAVAVGSTAGDVPGIDDAIAISTGNFCGEPTSCALHATGEVSCWGLRFWSGSVDPCDRRPATPPELVSGIDDAVGIATNGAMLCAVRRTGDVVCTGVESLTGAMGIDVPWHMIALGVPQTVVPPTTMLLPSHDAIFVGVGNTFSCALLSSGAVYCSGANTLGELGDGLVGDSLVPVPVLGL